MQRVANSRCSAVRTAHASEPCTHRTVLTVRTRLQIIPLMNYHSQCIRHCVCTIVRAARGVQSATTVPPVQRNHSLLRSCACNVFRTAVTCTTDCRRSQTLRRQECTYTQDHSTVSVLLSVLFVQSSTSVRYGGAAKKPNGHLRSHGTASGAVNVLRHAVHHVFVQFTHSIGAY